MTCMSDSAPKLGADSQRYAERTCNSSVCPNSSLKLIEGTLQYQYSTDIVISPSLLLLKMEIDRF